MKSIKTNLIAVMRKILFLCLFIHLNLISYAEGQEGLDKFLNNVFYTLLVIVPLILSVIIIAIKFPKKNQPASLKFFIITWILCTLFTLMLIWPLFHY